VKIEERAQIRGLIRQLVAELRGFIGGEKMEAKAVFVEELFRYGVEGSHRLGNELIVGESATIEGDIHVGRIAISGTVIGKIVATQRVEIHRNGKVYSDIDTPALIIEEGAVFQGNCVMGDRKSANVTNIAAKG